MEQRASPDGTLDRLAITAHRDPLSSDERREALTIAAAVDLFFGDLRLAPRTKKTYWHGIAKFLRHLSQHEGIDPETAPVSALRPDHVTSFAAILVPPDIRTPEEVSQMRTAQNNISAVRKLCSYLSATTSIPTLRATASKPELRP